MKWKAVWQYSWSDGCLPAPGCVSTAPWGERLYSSIHGWLCEYSSEVKGCMAVFIVIAVLSTALRWKAVWQYSWSDGCVSTALWGERLYSSILVPCVLGVWMSHALCFWLLLLFWLFYCCFDCFIVVLQNVATALDQWRHRGDSEMTGTLRLPWPTSQRLSSVFYITTR